MRDERPIGLSRVYFSHQTDLVIFFPLDHILRRVSVREINYYQPYVGYRIANRCLSQYTMCQIEADREGTVGSPFRPFPYTYSGITTGFCSICEELLLLQTRGLRCGAFPAHFCTIVNSCTISKCSPLLIHAEATLKIDISMLTSHRV